MVKKVTVKAVQRFALVYPHFAVAFGIIGQLILDGAPTSELDRYIGLMHSVDLPVTFADLGIPDISDDDIRLVAKAACAPMAMIWSMDSLVSEEIVFHAIKGADAAGRDYLARLRK
ncbi:hypothetical protein EVG20_g11671 [Dentipellis fragilis]|uniref:Uncharacterized protein n=1 Tax=Dentipellis fragilis TaxID=205917 RepID=A0A4Y9XLE7_9AGAM|nr:hypothetical protein EVG20_g11671 [Dentipellis fragilis]